MIQTTQLPQILRKNRKDELFDNEVLMQAFTLKEINTTELLITN